MFVSLCRSSISASLIAMRVTRDEKVESKGVYMSARPSRRTRVVPFVARPQTPITVFSQDFAGHLVILTRRLQVQEADHPARD